MSSARSRLLSQRALAQPDYAVHLDGDGDDDNTAPLAIFCPDLSCSDILADPATGNITALLQLAFTNAMPAAFASPRTRPCDTPPLPSAAASSVACCLPGRHGSSPT